MNLLHTIGLMTRAEHERIVERYDDLLAEYSAAETTALAQFKRAATDLAKQAEEIEGLRAENETLTSFARMLKDDLYSVRDSRNAAMDEIASLRPDALKWRDSLKRSRDRKAARKGSVS